MKHRTIEWITATQRLGNALDNILYDFTNSGKPVGDDETIQADLRELYAAHQAWLKADKKGWQSK